MNKMHIGQNSKQKVVPGMTCFGENIQSLQA